MLKEKKGRVLNDSDAKKFLRRHKHYNITQGTLSKIAHAFNSILAEETMENVYGVLLPDNIGIIYLANTGKTKAKIVDYKRSKDVGSTVYHKNFETDNNLMRICYINHTNKSIVENSKLYTFKPTKSFQRKASQYFRKNWAKVLSTNYKSNRLITV